MGQRRYQRCVNLNVAWTTLRPRFWRTGSYHSYVVEHSGLGTEDNRVIGRIAACQGSYAVGDGKDATLVLTVADFDPRSTPAVIFRR